MIARRELLAAGAATLLLPRFAHAAGHDALSFTGAMEQGALVVGHATPGARVSVDGKPVLVSPGGDFAFGFSYNQSRATNVVARFADGTHVTRAVTPRKRHYKTQRINGLPPKLVTPSHKNLERIRREHIRLAKVRARDTDGVGFAEPFEWPFPGIISGVYGSRRIDNGTPMSPHLGVDIAAPEGTPIHAPADAVVAIVDDYFLEGGFTVLDHGHGVNTCYLHQSKRMVKVGDKVRRGQVIGLVGQTGRATGPHTHWGLCLFQRKLDPSLSTPTRVPPRS
jgi:murein DD-endopeptidase MepM/ murein hydrolase activator NlpD